MMFSRPAVRAIVSRRFVANSATTTTKNVNRRRLSTTEAPRPKAYPIPPPTSGGGTGGSVGAAAAGGAGKGGGGSGMAEILGAVALVGVIGSYYDSGTKIKGLEDRINSLEVSLASKTNSAFVFIKPHACKGKHPQQVYDLVESKLRNAGIKITDSGELTAEQIDQNMYIDTHYGAIASKAVKIQPKDLNVPDKAKAEFAKTFGEESWESAVAAGKVYNAKDGAAKLGLDAAGLNAKWSKLTKGKDLLKFGGGFYCGKVDGIYIINGFYMSMRSAYCTPGEKIRWYTVTWPSDALSWGDFRGHILGATDPSAAPVGSIRRTILDQYVKLGLSSMPNTGDNGVHASASPFEAFCERRNWLGVKDLESDEFAKAMLLQGVKPESIAKWSEDAQVTIASENYKGSVFDALEDLDTKDVLDKVTKIEQ